MRNMFPTEYGHGIIFDETVNKVLLTNVNGTNHVSVYTDMTDDQTAPEALSNYCTTKLNIKILPSEWTNICTLTNIDNNWRINVYLTIQLFDILNTSKNGKVITTDIDTLKSYKCTKYTSWLLPLCKDCKVDGKLTKIIYNASSIKEYSC